jgi:hypothetical protein
MQMSDCLRSTQQQPTVPAMYKHYDNSNQVTSFYKLSLSI